MHMVSPRNININITKDYDSISYDFTYPRQDADIILVSGDKPSSEAKLFYVHRTILAAASLFFRDMFTLPQPAPSSLSHPGAAAGEEPDLDPSGVPRILLTESHTVLSLILHLIYPFPKPDINPDTLPIPLFSDLLGAATKYDLYFPLSYLRSIFVSPEAGGYLEADPKRVYAVACRHNLEWEATEAMKWVVKTGVDMRTPLTEEWRFVSAWEYIRLEGWVEEKRSRVGKLVERWYKARQEVEDADQAMDESYESGVPKCVQCNSSPFSRADEPKWWTEFVKRVSEKQGVGMGGTNGIFAMSFLADVVKACGCPRCAASALTCARFMEQLKECIGEILNQGVIT